MKRRQFVRGAIAGAGAAAMQAAFGQEFPSRPIQIVVPFPPGGANDILGRLMAQKLGELLPGNVLVDNRAGGAAGAVGAQYVAAAAPDGYTLLLGNTASLSINPSIYPNLKYDPQVDFEPVGLIGSSSLVLVVNEALRVNTVAEFIRLLKASPGKYAYASAGAGTPLHLAGELFKLSTGTDMTHIPYRGTAPAYTDLLSGRVNAMFDNTTTAVVHAKAGSVRALAVTGKTRSPLFPDTPTFAEAGFKELEVLVWFGLVAPKGTSRLIVDKLNGAVAAAVRSEDTKRRMLELDIEPWGSSPATMREFMSTERSKWRNVVQKAGIKLD